MSKYFHGLYLAIILALLAAGAFLFRTWLESHDDQLRLHSTLDAQKQLLDAADARERERAATLKETLAQIDSLKRATQTPTQVLQDLPKYLQLPQPITLSSSPITPAHSESVEQGTDASPEKGSGAIHDSAPPASIANLQASIDGSPGAGELPSAPVAQIPASDLKPLYDYIQDCRACQAQLTSAKQNAADDAAKLAALTRERDAAIQAAKGGSFWMRLRRNARWFLVGATAGAAALCDTGHCRP
ncbi:MAG TPA: hypothetical protein VEG64_17565 [Candidatus Sulfotelmatobacter sp.]|nr:hypothetical protein [Candidatus Sulfotelmatobacter sp.]